MLRRILSCQVKSPPFDLHIADVPPAGPTLAEYDEENMRMLDADQQGASWRDVFRIVLRIDPDTKVGRPTGRLSKAASSVLGALALRAPRNEEEL